MLCTWCVNGHVRDLKHASSQKMHSHWLDLTGRNWIKLHQTRTGRVCKFLSQFFYLLIFLFLFIRIYLRYTGTYRLWVWFSGYSTGFGKNRHVPSAKLTNWVWSTPNPRSDQIRYDMTKCDDFIWRRLQSMSSISDESWGPLLLT